MTSAAEIIRANSIGSSDIAAIAGFSPFAGEWDVYAWKKGLIEPLAETERMFWGKELQEPIARVVGRRLKLDIEWADRRIVSPERAWQTASPDAYAIQPRSIVEIKTAGVEQTGEWGPDGADERGVPEHYWAQAQWQMTTARIDRAFIAVLIGGNNLRIYSIRHNPGLEDILLEAGERFFYQHLMAEVEPPIRTSRYAADYLKRRWPRERSETRPATPAEITLLDEYAPLRTLIDQSDKRREELENTLKESIADAEGLVWPGGRLTWKKSKDRSETNWERLAREQLSGFSDEERAAVIEQFTDVVHGSRRFLLRREKVK